MLTKDILKTPLTTELVAVHPNSYIHRSSKNANDLPENKALVGKLVGYDTYYESNYTDPDPYSPRFQKSTSEKTKRFLMEFLDPAGTSYYRVIPAIDIIAPKSQMEARWAEVKVIEAEQSAQRQKIAEAEQAVEQKRRAEEESLKHAVSSNLVELFGTNWEQLGVDMHWVRVKSSAVVDPQGAVSTKLSYEGRVDIPVQLFLRMVQRFADQ